jgi:hypothetical protein
MNHERTGRSMKKKRYRSIYDALDDVLMGSMDTSGVRSAKERYEEKKRQQQAQQPKFVTMEEALDPKRDKIRKLQAIIDDPGATVGEKDNARRLLEKIKNRG